MLEDRDGWRPVLPGRTGDGWVPLAAKAAGDQPDPYDGPLPEEPLVEAATPVLRQIWEDYFRIPGVEISFDVRDRALEDYLRRFGAERIRDLVGTTTKKELGRALAEVQAEGPTFPKLVAAVRRVFDRAGQTRAELIARTETTIAAGAATQRAIEATGTERRLWLSSRDHFVRDTHQRLDGQIKPASEPFEMDGYKAMAPGHFGVARQDCNCRCVLIPLPDEKAAEGLSTKAARDDAWRREGTRLSIAESQMKVALQAGFQAQAEAVIAYLEAEQAEGKGYVRQDKSARGTEELPAVMALELQKLVTAMRAVRVA